MLYQIRAPNLLIVFLLVFAYPGKGDAQAQTPDDIMVNVRGRSKVIAVAAAGTTVQVNCGESFALRSGRQLLKSNFIEFDIGDGDGTATVDASTSSGDPSTLFNSLVLGLRRISSIDKSVSKFDHLQVVYGAGDLKFVADGTGRIRLVAPPRGVAEVTSADLLKIASAIEGSTDVCFSR